MNNQLNTIQEAFEQGFDSVVTKLENPYLLTSDMSDAFELGDMARTHKFPRSLSDAVRKSRGSTWFIGATAFTVNGKAVYMKSSHPTIK